MSHQVSIFFIDHADTHYFEAQFQLYLNVTIPTILYIYATESCFPGELSHLLGRCSCIGLRGSLLVQLNSEPIVPISKHIHFSMIHRKGGQDWMMKLPKTHCVSLMASQAKVFGQEQVLGASVDPLA